MQKSSNWDERSQYTSKKYYGNLYTEGFPQDFLDRRFTVITKDGVWHNNVSVGLSRHHSDEEIEWRGNEGLIDKHDVVAWCEEFVCVGYKDTEVYGVPFRIFRWTTSEEEVFLDARLIAKNMISYDSEIANSSDVAKLLWEKYLEEKAFFDKEGPEIEQDFAERFRDRDYQYYYKGRRVSNFATYFRQKDFELIFKHS